MSKLRTAFEHPWTAVRTAKSHCVRPFVSAPSNRTNILLEDWDNLIILDACRYDTFQQCNSIAGDLQRNFSTASHTAEFVENNLTKPFPDVVYATASPQLAGQETRFHRLVHVWEDHWDEELKTVTPAAMTERSRELSEQYPNKRLIVHYMQPHYPFIGDKGRKIGRHATFAGNVANRDAPSVWDLLAAGKVDKELTLAAYEENLEIALEHVQELLDGLEGKTVISSDHGNLFREKVTFLPIRIEGHPMSFPHPDLLAVPWFEVPFDGRKEISNDTQLDDAVDTDGEVVQERLEDLGYV